MSAGRATAGQGARVALALGLVLAPGCGRRTSGRAAEDAGAAGAAGADPVAANAGADPTAADLRAAASAAWVAPVAIIDAVEVKLLGATEGAIVSRELGRRLARCLIEHGADVVALDHQVPADRIGRHARLEVELDAEAGTDAAAAPHIAVAYAARLGWLDDDTLPVPTARLLGESSILGGRADTAVLAVVDKLQPEVCRLLGDQLARLTAADLGPGLRDPDPEVVAWTLAVVAARRPTGLLDTIVPLLDRPAPVGEAAIGALVALGDRHAVTALTDRVDLTDRPRLTTVIEATIALGGPDAEDFLQVLSSHADPDIARHAREGLARMQRKAAPPPLPTP